MGSYAYAHRRHKGFVTLGEALDERSYRVGRTLGDYVRGCYIPISEEQLAFRGSLVEETDVEKFKAITITN